MGLGTVSSDSSDGIENGKEFSFNNGQGYPITLRNTDTYLVDGNILKWDATDRKLVDSGISSANLTVLDGTYEDMTVGVANKLGTNTVGNAYTPIYLNEGEATATTVTRITSRNYLDYDNNSNTLITTGSICWWNGAYNSSNASNLMYSYYGAIVGTTADQEISGLKTFSTAPLISATLSDDLDDTTVVTAEWVVRLFSKKTDLEAVKTELEEKINSEAEAREAADNDLQDAIDQEIADREAANDEIKSLIEDETEAREAADEVLETAIEQEVADREAAITQIQESITNITNGTTIVTEAGKVSNSLTLSYSDDSETYTFDGSEDVSVTIPVYEGDNSTIIIDENNTISVNEVSPSQVIFDDDFILTEPFGIYDPTAEDSGRITVECKGKSLQEFLESALQQEASPEVTQPSATLTVSRTGYVEVGTTVTETFSVTFNEGSYQYGPDSTGVIVESYSISDTNGSTAGTSSGSLNSFVVADGTTYRVTAVVAYSDGVAPYTNLGNEDEASKITAGSITRTSSYLYGYRAMFYGTLTDKSGEIDSATIRALTTSARPTSGSTVSVSIPVGAYRVIIAVPSTFQVTSVKDVNGMNAEIFSSFTSIQVEVNGYDNYDATTYNVYYIDSAEAVETANTYTATIASA